VKKVLLTKDRDMIDAGLQVMAGFPSRPLILTGAAIRFFIAYELAPKVLAEAIAQLTRWINERLLRHAVVARYALDRTVDAQEVIEQGTHIGNVVVTI